MIKINRQERRNYVKKLNTPQKLEKYSMDLSRRLRDDYEKAYRQKYNEDLNTAINNFILAITYTLHFHEATSFGSKRIDNFMKDMLEVIDGFRTGEFTPEEYREQLKQDGIIVK